uniref:GP-PDE domain-containing protein n=1 Tax=Bursaphelenchus xylophilus TaxID=6326 RepID=A0A1I7RWK8_BURXY
MSMHFIFFVSDGKKLISDGWLNHQSQTEVRLFMYDNCMTFYKDRHQQRQYHIKITPFDLRRKEEYNPYNRAQKGRGLWRMSSVFMQSMGSFDIDEPEDKDANAFLPALPSFSPTELAVLSTHDAAPTFSDQKSTGQPYHNPSSIFIYRTQSIAPDFLAFRVELFTEQRPKKPSQPPTIDEDQVCNSDALASIGISNAAHNALLQEHSYDAKKSVKIERVGIAYVMFSARMDTCGQHQVPILAKNQMPIGQLKMDYLLIKSLGYDLKVPLTMEHCYTRHWKKRKTVEVGHRGFGNSYTKTSTVRENTIHSLSHASKKGADYVEFDVQLTKDKIAIIFHDFHVLVAVAKRSTCSPGANLSKETEAAAVGTSGPQRPSLGLQNAMSDYHEIAVKDLKLQQLRLLHVEHYQAQENRNMLKVTGDPDESDDHRPFPTLVDVLKRVPVDTGFNVEIKYPMELADGEHECRNYFERNEFIDRILKDVIENAGARRIVFSSFEPDICSMIARKQCLFPCLFLCVGATKRYVPFTDKRSADSIVAANFAKSEKILGCNFHSEELLHDRRPVERAKRLGLVSFVWGDDLDSKKNIDYFRRDLAVEGIIYDK